MSMKHLAPFAKKALKKKRAIVFLENCRLPAMQGYLLSVVGCIDDATFYFSLFPDGYTGKKAITVELKSRPVEDRTTLALESSDAMVVHQLWLEWFASRHDEFVVLAIAIGVADASKKHMAAAPRKPHARKSK